MLVQVCTRDHLAARVDKLVRAAGTPALLRAGLRVEVWAWGTLARRGKRKAWECTKRPIALGSIPPPERREV